MPNIICNYNCNNNCSFCFVDNGKTNITYSIKRLEEQSSFLNSFENKSINLIGGEPTLNPAFIEILQWFINHDFQVNIFTNGTVKTDVINKLQILNLEKVSFCVNRSIPNNNKYVFNLFRSLGYLTQLSVTVFHPKQDLSHIIREIKQFQLSKKFRLGIALPIYGKKNNYLKPIDYYKTSIALFEFIKCCKENEQIQPGFDCGFPFCFFSDKQKEYFVDNDIKFSSSCGTIPDINAKNEFVPCFPLSHFKFNFLNTDIWEKRALEVNNILQQQSREPIFEDCKSCSEINNGNCFGGCFALQLRKNQKFNLLQ